MGARAKASGGGVGLEGGGRKGGTCSRRDAPAASKVECRDKPNKSETSETASQRQKKSVQGCCLANTAQARLVTLKNALECCIKTKNIEMRRLASLKFVCKDDKSSVKYSK
jgi:hypothetical protein